MACQAILLGGLLFLHPAIRRGVPRLVTAIALVARGDVSGSAERLSPHAGEVALTPLPRELVTIAREQRLQAFALSARLAGDAGLLQRVTEGAWPIQLSAGSPDLFVARGEVLPPPCVLRQTGEFVAYARCG